jgi:hypothetical protein
MKQTKTKNIQNKNIQKFEKNKKTYKSKTKNQKN